ncbi:hypothetical protein OGR47_18060 [Methylocystis sp. MJC1]|uniref:hypothetical protein n=1 Tax=Methylocystis sp. MJC1 TaxID=2654282 RepID=UPI0013EBB662|nr:hypothetical protein [Methylocystis sp. MJC1]KAF2988940.1 hypothetical protein MJC1_03953 [Methylocystis sp. MJC1]MBU6528862.1 hypothetical protein [Methylocystis sp. MJC1]UZX11746.1 hypothetical protein OGR47_18060 [Methylocystis sp. MJC1]
MSVFLRNVSLDVLSEGSDQRSSWTRSEPCSQWRVLSLPFALDKEVLPPGVVSCEIGELPDFVVINDAASFSHIGLALSPAAAAIVPVINATGIPGEDRVNRRGDFSIGIASARAFSDALITLSPMISRLRQLSPVIFQETDPRLLLLARLFVRDRNMDPSIDPAAKDAFVYPDEAAVEGAAKAAEELFDNGLLERQFFDALAGC